jgi:RNA polymerase sigma-70 factor (ECF subfamily)
VDGVVVVGVAERALVARARDDRAAFGAVYDRYFDRVYAYVRYRVGDPSVADDLTAATFERALASLDDYRPERGPFPPWLFAIARNAVLDHFRRTSRRRLLPLDALRDHRSPEPSPEEAVVGNETRDELLQAVARLGDRDRELLALRFGAGLRNTEIAAQLGLSEGNVGVLLYRAVRRLQADLIDEGDEHGRMG